MLMEQLRNYQPGLVNELYPKDLAYHQLNHYIITKYVSSNTPRGNSGLR